MFPRQDKRQRLMEAGEEFFSRFGARRVAVEEIRRTAGVRPARCSYGLCHGQG
jgi:AcrR family transcriptional regulator